MDVKYEVMKCFQRNYIGDFRDVYELQGVIKSLQRKGLFPSNKELKGYKF